MTLTNLNHTKDLVQRSNGASRPTLHEAPAKPAFPSKGTSYPFDGEGLCFNIPDKSMEPKIEMGSFIFIRLGLQPNPGDFVLFIVKETGELLFRRFYESDESISLELINPSWKPRWLSYPREEWPNAVDVIGVASSFETPLRTD
jgi:hypothetical protein